MCAKKKDTREYPFLYAKKREGARKRLLLCGEKLLFCLRMADRRQHLRQQVPVQEGREP